jgi:hypothetical protein
MTQNSEARPAIVPDDFVELSELGVAAIEHKLGYFGDDPLIIVGYCAGGGEVVWRDSQREGFGAGGWRFLLDEIWPLAQRYGVNLGSIGSAGSHVLLINRHHHAVYAAPRESAELFMRQRYGQLPPRRACLCGLVKNHLCPNCGK